MERQRPGCVVFANTLIVPLSDPAVALYLSGSNGHGTGAISRPDHRVGPLVHGDAGCGGARAPAFTPGWTSALPSLSGGEDWARAGANRSLGSFNCAGPHSTSCRLRRDVQVPLRDARWKSSWCGSRSAAPGSTAGGTTGFSPLERSRTFVNVRAPRVRPMGRWRGPVVLRHARATGAGCGDVGGNRVCTAWAAWADPGITR